jgi:L-ascorbate metabolism protein UlaG (beta-lactamase superfamily)
MNLTKYGHACLFIGEDNNKLVIDPGDFTELPKDLKNISVLIVSEEHYDHFGPKNIRKIVEQSPEAKIFSTVVVSDKLNEEGIECHAVDGEETFEESGYKIKLSEGDHAVVYGSSPCRVLTVTINDFLYYPSDSFIGTKDKVKVLALPTSGPWHKLSEAIDLMKATDAEFVIATHNGLHNEAGNDVANRFIDMHSKDPEKEFVYLSDGESRDF